MTTAKTMAVSKADAGAAPAKIEGNDAGTGSDPAAGREAGMTPSVTAAAEEEPATGLPAGRFSGRLAFAQGIRDALATAAREGWSEIVLSDADFGDWPLAERVVVESLTAWSASGRRCTLLARHFDAVMRNQARFVRWRGLWSHIIEAHRCGDADAFELPSAIWSPHWALQRLDIERSVGWSGNDPERRVALREALRHWLHKSSPAFPATTLGL